jgi:two-component system LytT family response regulator
MNILIIEDEPAAVRRLKKLLLTILPNATLLGTAESIEESLQLIGKHKEADLIFMDIHLADGSSFEIFRHMEVLAPIIFTTAYDQYAIKAFKVNAVDYLLKPIKKEELERALVKYQQMAASAEVNYQELANILQPEEQVKRFLIKFGQQIRLVSMPEVAYFYTEDKITFLVTKGGKRYPVDQSLEKLEAEVNASRFFRINRQFIISIDAIDEMYVYSKSRVKVTLNPPADIDTIVSTERSPHFKKWLVGERQE